MSVLQSCILLNLETNFKIWALWHCLQFIYFYVHVLLIFVVNKNVPELPKLGNHINDKTCTQEKFLFSKTHSVWK